MVNKIQWILYLFNIFEYKIFSIREKSYELFYKNIVLKGERYVSIEKYVVVIFIRKDKSILSGQFDFSDRDTDLELIRKIWLVKKIIISKRIPYFNNKELSNYQNKQQYSFIRIRNNAKGFIADNYDIIKNFLVFELRVFTREHYKLVDRCIDLTWVVPNRYRISVDMINKAANDLELTGDYKTESWQEVNAFLIKNMKNIRLLDEVKDCRIHGLYNVVFYEQDVVEIIKFLVKYPKIFDSASDVYIKGNNLKTNNLSIDIIIDKSCYSIYKNGLLVKGLDEYRELEIFENEDEYKYYVKCNIVPPVRENLEGQHIHVLSSKGLRIEKTGSFSAIIVLASYKKNGKILYFTNGILKGSLSNIKYRNVTFLEDKYKSYNYEGPKGVSIDNINLYALAELQ
jgi:hypothetical protein